MDDADTARALKIWAEYQEQHDLCDRKGQAAGIDPVTGRVWFGESSTDIVQQMKAEGGFRPLYFIRVGYDYYVRKGAAEWRQRKQDGWTLLRSPGQNKYGPSTNASMTSPV